MAHLHIKRVTIRGFKTYRQETVIDALSPHVNIILGKNGSGKVSCRRQHPPERLCDFCCSCCLWDSRVRLVCD
jgi:hypothetical protein